MSRLLLVLILGASITASCSKDPCEEAYEKEQSCVQGMNCDQLGPGLSGQCQAKKNLYSQSYTLFKAACGVSCNCEGAKLEESERINNCTLAPANLCQCR